MPSEFFNPADHLLDLVSVDHRPETQQKSVSRVRAIIDSWHAIENKETGDETVPAAVTNEHTTTTPKTISSGSKTTPMRIALPVVLQRHWLNIWRQPQVFVNRFLQTPFVGALFIFFFQRLNHGPQGAQDRIGISIQSTSAVAFVGLLNSMAVLPSERNLYLHESASSARYSPATWILMYSLVEITPAVVAALGYSAIMNVAVGMQTSARIFFEFFASIWALGCLGESFAIAVGMWVRSEGLTVT